MLRACNRRNIKRDQAGLLGISGAAFIGLTSLPQRRRTVNRVNGELCMIEAYNRSEIDTGTEAVRHWANGFKPGADVLEIGFWRCAIPQLLIDAGLRLHLVEASISRLSRFQQLFPEVPSECLQGNRCMVFSRTFDGVIVCSLTHSVPEPTQIALLARIERVLRAGGRLLVIFPPPASMPAGFKIQSWSHRAKGSYEGILWNLGLEVQPDLVDQSGNQYVCAVKHVQAGVPD
jgi:SAM-dependent methyltransferase